jgi:hypothetical protein
MGTLIRIQLIFSMRIQTLIQGVKPMRINKDPDPAYFLNADPDLIQRAKPMRVHEDSDLDSDQTLSLKLKKLPWIRDPGWVKSSDPG